MRRVFRPIALTFSALLAVVLVSGCSATKSGSSASAAAAAIAGPKPDYASHTDHFVALQSAGLNGDYPAFARHLKADNPQAVIADLQRSFQGRPFDVYTRKAMSGPKDHRRFVELRSTTGRLYLALVLDKVTGGWRFSRYDLGRNQAVISAKL